MLEKKVSDMIKKMTTQQYINKSGSNYKEHTILTHLLLESLENLYQQGIIPPKLPRYLVRDLLLDAIRKENITSCLFTILHANITDISYIAYMETPRKDRKTSRLISHICKHDTESKILTLRNFMDKKNYAKEEFTKTLSQEGKEKSLLVCGFFKFGNERIKKQLLLPRPIQNMLFNLILNDMPEEREAVILQKMLSA